MLIFILASFMSTNCINTNPSLGMHEGHCISDLSISIIGECRPIIGENAISTIGKDKIAPSNGGNDKIALSNGGNDKIALSNGGNDFTIANIILCVALAYLFIFVYSLFIKKINEYENSKK